MENEEIIRLAVQLTEENNSVYKKAARNQAFMIKAEDSSGTVDTFITIQGTQNADDWKKQFETAGFKRSKRIARDLAGSGCGQNCGRIFCWSPSLRNNPLHG